MNFKNMELNELIEFRKELDRIILEKQSAEQIRLWGNIISALREYISNFGVIAIESEEFMEILNLVTVDNLKDTPGIINCC